MSRALAVAVLIAGLTGCAVGPKFEPPAEPAVSDYVSNLPPETAAAPVQGGDAQRFVAAADVPADWWTLFGSPGLDALVDEALANSPTLEAAKAALRQANELRDAQRGTRFPTVQVGYSGARQQDAVGTLSPTLASSDPSYSLHTTQVNVSYLLDLFGQNRRRVESAAALAEAQQFDFEGASLTLTSNVVAAAIEEASLREQLAATEEIVRGEREVTEILRRQADIGAIPPLDVMAQEAQLATTEASLPALEKQLAQQRDLLAALVGRFPSDDTLQSFHLADLMLPRDLPIGVPSNLVRQRPDVREAEARLHAATADVGVAVGDMLPQFSLVASGGGVATQFVDMFAAGNIFWAAGVTLSETLFAGGALKHKKRAAEAALDQAGAEYKGVVLLAFQNVADSLHALELDAEGVGASARAEQASARNLEATRRNVEIGAASNLALLNAEQTYNEAQVSLAAARASRFADTAALFQALGGGWGHAQADAAETGVAQSN